ncbi:hypothetical protein COCNU_13G005700 [Cocos nucifera]|uniref:Uncharacterized protein n=1 Tax=Cocos nucifera TaxID=13894 RepID=A0A8K0NC57_COCNU|nr:hypothetical protein COCNU_13G005700 [Cocos nucifera]
MDLRDRKHECWRESAGRLSIPITAGRERKDLERCEALDGAFALDAGRSPNINGQQYLDGDNAGLGRTRLGIMVRATARQLLEKLDAARKNFPTKIFLVLLGLYTANALATILGQSGEWDVLVAGIVVAAIEGIFKNG